MKKLFYILLLSVAASLSITACTEENVEPKNETGNTTGGGTSERP